MSDKAHHKNYSSRSNPSSSVSEWGSPVLMTCLTAACWSLESALTRRAVNREMREHIEIAFSLYWTAQVKGPGDCTEKEAGLEGGRSNCMWGPSRRWQGLISRHRSEDIGSPSPRQCSGSGWPWYWSPGGSTPATWLYDRHCGSAQPYTHQRYHSGTPSDAKFRLLHPGNIIWSALLQKQRSLSATARFLDFLKECLSNY